LIQPLNSNIERTEVIHGTESVIGTELHFFSEAKTRIDTCMDSTRPALAIGIEPIRKSFAEAKRNGVHLRYLTEITNDNLSSCKEIIKIVDELRHLDGIKGNFMISESEYLAPITSDERMKPAFIIIFSNVKEIIEHQQYVFDTFWNKAIPAEQRITEIEEGVDRTAVEVIPNSNRAREMYLKLIKNAEKEIILMFPTINAFNRQERMGVFELSKALNIKVRMLVPAHKSAYQTLQNLRELHSNFHVRYIEQTSGTQATFLVVDGKFSLVMEIRDDSKTTFDEAIGLSTYSNSNAGVLSYVAIFENLWKQTELYEDIKKAHEQLKLHAKAQKEFINVAAHELRTPIQPILTTVGILHSKKGHVSSQQMDDSLEMIHRNAQRLKRLAEDILDVTKIESQSLILNKERLNLSDVVISAIKDVKNQIQDRLGGGAQILYESKGDDTIFIQADRYRVAQLVTNLLSNALKFVKRYDGIVSISIEKKEDVVADGHEVALVSVKDNGTGIDPDIFPRLFEKFASKSFNGIGLGLFMCRSIVEAHGGRIWAENNRDKGATFHFTLPILRR
jgi:two-component system, OmpR family, sensor histidine kinase VicK